MLAVLLHDMLSQVRPSEAEFQKWTQFFKHLLLREIIPILTTQNHFRCFQSRPNLKRQTKSFWKQLHHLKVYPLLLPEIESDPLAPEVDIL